MADRQTAATAAAAGTHTTENRPVYRWIGHGLVCIVMCTEYRHTDRIVRRNKIICRANATVFVRYI